MPDAFFCYTNLFSHKYFSNYYLIITFFSLETMFLLLKFFESHKQLQIFSFYENEIFTRDTQICLFLHNTCWYLFQPMHQIVYTLQLFLLLHMHISFASLPYSALQYIFGTMIRFLVPFHVHIFCLAFFVCNHFEFLFQSF